MRSHHVLRVRVATLRAQRSRVGVRQRRQVHLPSAADTKKIPHITESDKEALEFLAERGRDLGIRLTSSERKLILDAAKRSGRSGGGDGGKMSKSDWRNLVSRRSLEDQERFTLAEYMAKSHDHHLGQHILQWTARLGISFLAMTGAHAAGEVGMHVVGSTMVGCVTALGGGTFNNLVTGTTPVGWVRNPSFLFIAVGASLVGFYGWPLVSDHLQQQHEHDHDEDGGGGGSGDHDYDEPVRYALESVALGALAIVGAQQGIMRGLHPFVSAALGVTVTFGGIVRDLMCHRDVKVGASSGCQSYGISSFAGAGVYVMLRELHVWNCAGSTAKLVHGGIPIGLRILLGFGTVIGVRAMAWETKPDDLLLSMEESARVNRTQLQRVVDRYWQSSGTK